MQWMHNSDSVSKEQLNSNAKAAANACDAAGRASDYNAVYAALSTADDIAHAAYCAAHYTTAISVKHWLRKANERLNEYFELTKENRQEYEQQIKYLSVLGANND